MTLDALRMLNDGVLIAALAVFCAVGASLPWVVLQHMRLRRKGIAREAELLRSPLPADGELSHVLVQLPTFNDGAVIRRVAEACGNLNWPRAKLHIQILDDSTDGTTEIARDVAASLRSSGIDAVLFHRTTRNGFKGAALQAGLRHSDHEYVAIFDADFVPPPDFLRSCLRRLVPDPGLAFVQARWDGLNANENALTRAQQYAIDAFNAVHQTARSWSGNFVQFTGSCAVWRRAAVDDAGGWASDILPEDLDISYRALLRGWRAQCLMTVAVPGELPHTYAAWQRQQKRWGRGHAQAMRKYLWAVLSSDLPLGGKLVGFFCLASCAFGAAVGVIALAGAIHFLLGASAGVAMEALAAIALIETGCAMLGMMLAQRTLRGARLWRELPRALAAIAVLLYAQLAGASSILDTLRGKPSHWVSTPKRGSQPPAGPGRLASLPSAEEPSE